MDNFYTSMTLLLWLWQRKVQACGTLRKRKGNPVLNVDKKSPKDSYDYKYEQVHPSNILVGAWMDNKLTMFMSTIHSHERNLWMRYPSPVLKPDAVRDYTKYMNGIDVNDQKRSYYDIRIQSHKWTHHVFYWVIDTAIVNSHIVYNRLNPFDQLSLLHYRRRLALELAGEARRLKYRKNSKRSKNYVRSREAARHFSTPAARQDSTPKLRRKTFNKGTTKVSIFCCSTN